MLRVSQTLESLVQFVTYIPDVKKKNCIWVGAGESVAVSSFCDPEDCSPPGSSVHGNFQLKI